MLRNFSVRQVGLVSSVLGLALVVGGVAAGGTADGTWTDDFEDSSLDSRWSWVREDPTHWSLTERPGFLRITTQKGGLLSDSNNAKNLLVQDAPSGDFEIQTRVVFTPTENFQIAGLLVYQDDDNFLMLGRAYCEIVPPDPNLCPGNGIYFDFEEAGKRTGSNFSMRTTVPSEAYLRLVREDKVYTGYVSENGMDWTMVGRHTTSLVPAKVGLAAEDSDTGAAEIPADFDFFQLVDTGGVTL